MSKNEERYLLQALDHEGVLRAYLSRCLQNESEVDELLQETYARLLTAGSSDDVEVRSIRAYALAIAHNVASDHLHKRPSVPVELLSSMETPHDADQGEPVEKIVSGPQDLSELISEIQELPRPCRQALTLRKVYGYSQAQIASRLGASEQQVEAHLTDAARRCARVVFAQPMRKQRGLTLLDRFRARKRAHGHGG